VVIDKITDVDALRTLAKGLQTYQARLERRNKELAEENARLRGEVSPEQLELMATKREEELARLRKQVFGKSSERRTPPVKEEPKAKEPQRGHGPTAQPRLPTREIHHELGPECRHCSSCGGEVGELTDMGVTEDSEMITIDSRKIVLEVHRRHKYRCACNAAVKTAPGPLRLIPGGRYSIEFGIAVVLGKREEHLPLERQRRVMAREGLDVTTQTLCDLEAAVAELLRPSYELVLAYIHGADELGADETRWRMMGGGGTKTWWMWCLTTDDAAYYTIDPSRSGEVARRLLGRFQGTVVCDGYSVYASLAHPETGVKGLRLAHCYSHVRRKFFDIQGKYPVESEEALKRLDALFVVERGLPRLKDLEGDAKIAAIDERARVRSEVSKPLVDALFEWAKRQRSLPSSGLREALRYMLERERGLRAFVDDPLIPIDNNRAERALRGPVLGRKNHYGSRSKRGTEVAAILYTLVETCRRCGVDPEHYLREALKRALSDPGGGLLPQALLHRTSS
jgi:transposase